MATLTDPPNPHPSNKPHPPPPSSLFLVRSFFPPVLLGIKTSIHAPEETHSGGEKRGRREGGGGGKRRGCQGERFEDGWDQTRRCLKLYVCFYSACSTSTRSSLPQIQAASGKVGWEHLEVWLRSRKAHKL